MLWIAPGKGRPFSQQEELILFECSLRSLKGGILQWSFGEVYKWKPDHCWINKLGRDDLKLTPVCWLSGLRACTCLPSLLCTCMYHAFNSVCVCVCWKTGATWGKSHMREQSDLKLNYGGSCTGESDKGECTGCFTAHTPQWVSVMNFNHKLIQGLAICFAMQETVS